MIRTFGNDIKKVFTGTTPVKAVYSYGTKVWPKDGKTPITRNYLRFDATTGDCTISITSANLARFNNLQYSTGYEEDWTPFTGSVLIPDGQTVYLKADGMYDGTGKNGFVTSGKVECHGNVMSLAGGQFEDNKTLTETQEFARLFYNTKITTAPELPATTLTEACYQSMFYFCTSLTQAPELPATTLSEHCYQGMFQYCSKITTAPELPATTLSEYCYFYMFYGCSSLTQAPELPATTLSEYCYYRMFGRCTSLTQAPELPATTLVYYCYYSMFEECNSLTQAPELPATTLSIYCYFNMFNGCSSLTQAPELPATTLTDSCYYGMFIGCSSLTQAPELPATYLNLNCYANMFNGCSNLNYIKAMFTTEPSEAYMQNWVTGVAETGTFVKSANATWEDSFGTSKIPTGWTVVTS